MDEAAWELDEVANEFTDAPPPPEYEERVEEGVDQIAQNFINNHSAAPPSYNGDRRRLPCPVIIPQRRPHTKARGFVRAYAPVLQDCGIDQQTFIDFLTDFEKASQASQIFTVINIAAIGVGMVPSAIAFAVSTAVQAASMTAQQAQARYRTNNFLDQINKSLFQPRGLYCMIMTFKPSDVDAIAVQTDINTLATKSITPASTKAKATLKQLRLSSGTTKGEVSMPEAAPLVFPAIDATTTGEQQSAMKKCGAFVSEYLDRRAQAAYNADNPNSILAVPQQREFASRFSDPNHPASSGNLISLVTGGFIHPDKGKNRLDVQGLYKAVREGREYKSPQQGPSQSNGGLLRKILKQNVLYLIVVNMPTDEEMEAAGARPNAGRDTEM